MIKLANRRIQPLCHLSEVLLVCFSKLIISALIYPAALPIVSEDTGLHSPTARGID
jgi:hypothetical protein